MNQLRAQMLQDVLQMGETEEWSQKPEEERPRCVTCGKPLLARGEQTRFTSRLRAIERQFEKFGMAHERAYEAPAALRRLE